MAPAKRDSPNRRKSIAVPDHNKPSFIARSKRRAHSIVPGDRVSPLARARRSLGPRKSILKGSTANLNGHGSQQSSQSTASQPSNADDLNTTQSMDFTTDFQDNTSRRSLGRRVSFAAHARVRLFQHLNHDNTSSTGTPPSSPISPPGHYREPQPQVNDENDYPGARPNGRRSSLRNSIAPSEDMDLTSVGFSNVGPDDSVVTDDEPDESVSRDDIDAINDALMHRRPSLAAGSSSQFPDEDLSRTEEAYPSDGTDQSREQDSMEFTIPINRSLRPAQQDEAWLALRRMTHSTSENTDEPGEDAETSAQSISVDYNTQEDSYNDTDNSREIDDENQTINVSELLGWPRQLEGDVSRMSIGDGSNMEESEVYGPAVPPAQTMPRSSLAPHFSRPSPPSPQEEGQKPPRSEQIHAISRPSVFQPPQGDAPPSQPLQPIKPINNQVQFPLQSPQLFTFTTPKLGANARPASPSKIPVIKPSFTAAFAPPVAKPTPKKLTTDTMPPNPPSMGKRPHPIEDDGSITGGDISIDEPSPAKRQAMASKWPGSTPTPAPTSPPSSTELPKPKPLSPSKKAPFQQTSSINASATRTTGSLRRPSGYLARRKSLAVGTNSLQSVKDSNIPEQSKGVSNQTSAAKKVGLGFRRVSVGSGSADAWQRFDKSSLPAQEARSDSQPTLQTTKDTDNTQSVRPAGTESPTYALAQPLPDSPVLSPARVEPQPQAPDSISPARRIVVARPTLSLDLSDVLQIMVDEEADERVSEVKIDSDSDTDTEDLAGTEIPPISIEQFFAITGIKFMDELTAPRRSTHPSHHPATRQVREENEISLAEYFVAMAIDVPQLELFTRVARDLEAWMEQSRSVYAQAEEEAAKITPELFIEYCRADDEGQTALLHQLHLIRTNVRAQAKSDWYDWKLQWVQGLKEIADKAFSALEDDAKMLEDVKAKADEILPILEREYESVMRELEQEKAEVAEIEASDQDYLNELKSAIADQNIEIEALQAEIAEGNSRLQRLQERHEEIEAQKKEASTAIANAQRVLHVQKSSTRAEVFRLKDELEALENLHMFRATRIAPELFQYIYNSQFQVTIPCRNFVPIVTQVDITRTEEMPTRYRDQFPKLSNFFLKMAKRQITEGDDLTLKQVVHRLGDYWSSCTQLRSQLRLLSIRYPVDIAIVEPTAEEGLPSFKAHTTVLFPAVKAKAIITFIFSTATFCYWPITLDSLDCEVKVEYGPVHRTNILKCVIDRLSQATPADNHAFLLDACIEAQEGYSS